MLRAPPTNRAKYEWHIDEGKHAQECTQQRTAIWVIYKSAQQEIADVHDPKHKGGRQPRVPSPPDTPHRLGPDGPGNQHDRDARDADFGAGDPEAVEFRLALPDVKEVSEEADKEGSLARPGRGCVKVKNLLNRTHGPFFRRNVKGRVGRAGH